ncbi:ABC transporter permease, partial [Streptomyces sp. NPDC057131]|uniref:ABC transporter permease n=1 Tax=Streptomyces sp. NPDC057131 TaxID=3346027 RepID=UPI00364248BD
MKLYKQKMIWIIIAILISTITLTLVVTLNSDEEETPSDWRNSLEEKNTVLIKQLADETIPEDYKKNTIEKELQLNNYRLDNDISPLYSNTAPGFVQETVGFTGLITLFIIIIAASIVSQEYTWGTIKLLLMRPVNRWKFLMAKFLTVILNALYLYILLFCLSLIVGTIVFGFSEPGLRYVFMASGEIKDVSIFYHFLQYFGSKFVGVIMIASFAFMISTIFKKNTIAITISIFIQFAGTLTSSVLSLLDKGFAKYLFFANTNLYQYVEGAPPEGQTLTFSIVNLII